MRGDRRTGRAVGILVRAVFCVALAVWSARADEVDLLLVLAVDTSGSVNEERFELQKRGYVAAFRDARLVRAIQGGGRGAVGVTMTQWTGPAMQIWAVPWMRVSDTPSAARFADAVAAAPRQLFGGGTSLSGAITHAATLFARAPFTAPRQVIDISGDGANNRGVPADVARDAAVAQGITINGLPILSLEPALDVYYRDHVIGGPRAFLIVAQGFESFADAILRKLILEIADRDRGNPALADIDSGQRLVQWLPPSYVKPGAMPVSQEQLPCRSPIRPCMQGHSTEPGLLLPMAVPPGF